MSKQSSTTLWWSFYPIRGFDIADNDHDLSSPLFGDATLVSKKHIKEIVSSIGFNGALTTGRDHEADITHLIENVTHNGDYHSLIAVKRTGPGDTSKLSTEDRKKFVNLARKRAFQIGALIALTLLSESTDWLTCGLVEQTHQKRRNAAMLAPDSKGFMFQMWGENSRTTIDLHKSNVTSREELREKLSGPNVLALSNILIPQKPTISGSLVAAVSEASIRLWDALQSTSPATQLLGSVTAIEILITNQGDSYETTKRRILALIGEEAYSFFEGEQILYDRHLYVHRGIEPSEGLLSLQSTALCLCCLLRYAEVAPHFTSKDNVLIYLDFLHLAGKMRQNWSSEEQRDFCKFIKHSQSRHLLPYFDGQSVEHH